MKKFYLILAVIIPFLIKAEKSLDELAIQFGTDKSTIGHGYAPIYDKYFKELRYKNINILEIGFYKGSSARMLEAYFPNANLYFIDIDQNALDTFGKGLSNRCHLYKIDQSNKDQLTNFIKGLNIEFDIIIDDGSHIMHHQIQSFESLYPYLKSNGIYCIEDLQTSYWPAYQINPNSNVTAISYLQNLVHNLNKYGISVKANPSPNPSTHEQKFIKELSYYERNIKYIHFYRCLCFVGKE